MVEKASQFGSNMAVNYQISETCWWQMTCIIAIIGHAQD